MTPVPRVYLQTKPPAAVSISCTPSAADCLEPLVSWIIRMSHVDAATVIQPHRDVCLWTVTKTSVIGRVFYSTRFNLGIYLGQKLPYGITQCYLPPDTSERAPTNPGHAGWYSIYRPGKDGRLSWPSWLDRAKIGHFFNGLIKERLGIYPG